MPEIYTRILQVTVPRDTLILLQKIMLVWTERDLPPARISKSQVVMEAIRQLAVQEGVLSTEKPLDLLPGPLISGGSSAKGDDE